MARADHNLFHTELALVIAEDINPVTQTCLYKRVFMLSFWVRLSLHRFSNLHPRMLSDEAG